jgi:BP28CT (NUC211) domain
MQRIFLVPSVVTETAVQIESAVVGAFIEFATKLNDTAFRPLFRKLFDWGFTGKPET